MTRSRGVKVALAAAGGLLLVVAIGVGLVVFTSTESCACAVPPSDEGAIETAQAYAAAVDEDPEAMLAEEASTPTAEQAEQLSLLDDPDTTWTVLATERPDGGYGRSPGERLVVGIAPDGQVGAVVVYTETDYAQGTVDPAVEARDIEPEIARSGQFPIFGRLNAGMSDEVRGHLFVASLNDGPLALSVTGRGGAWAYVGATPLDEERYRYVRGGQHSSDGSWWYGASWFAPSDPVTEGD